MKILLLQDKYKNEISFKIMFIFVFQLLCQISVELIKLMPLSAGVL